jgi:hypothetical protein
MSTLKVNTLQNASGVEQYLCKAWVNFNGTGTVAIRASGNVTSITDNGTGDYTVNFTNAMTDANYCVVCACTLSDSIVAGNTHRGFTPRSYTTSSVRLVVTDGVSGIDPLHSNVSVFR